MAEAEGGMTKSAKKRAAKKAKDAAEAVPETPAAPPPPPPAAEPKSKAKAKAKPEAKAEAKAQPKAQPKAEPKAEPKAQPKADPKAKAKGKAEPKAPAAPEPKAKAEPKAAPEPKAAAGKQKAKSGAKAKAGPKKDEEEEEQPKKKVEEMINYVIDDGTGGDWATASGLSIKAEKKKAKKAEEDAYIKQLQAEAGGKPLPKNMVPGMGPMDPKAAAAARANASQAASADVARILAKKEEAEVALVNVSVATITVPDKRIGIVIGPGGATIKMIQEKTKVTRIDTAGGVFTISGSGPAVEQARDAIEQLINRGFCSLLYDDFSENYINVHPQYFPDIIGKGGVIIQKIKKELKVEVSIPQGVEMDVKASKKYKVTLAGSSKQVEEAKEVLNSIILYSHHEITHPGIVHEEMEVENFALKYIIGKGGSEMKHIQKNWDVKVSIPREHSANQKVLIVGEPSNVERAKAYVERVLWNAENQVRGGGRDKQDEGDAWGDEEEEEPWMKDYIYRRA